MNTLTYLIHLEPEGGFTVTVPALPGCITYGETLELALERAREAVEGFLETLVQLGGPIPEELINCPAEILVQVKLAAIA
ncbi:MAG: type II toxin-antitoxin system HicB family antitoxin [Candidatus Hydrogenedentota bacterium]